MMKKYVDCDGQEILAGMRIVIDGTPESVLVEPCGEDDLGILATNMDFVRNYPETELKYYPLSNFSRSDLRLATDSDCTENPRDDGFLCERGDEIDNAVFEAIQAIAHPETEVEWSMELIGAVNDFIENLLLAHHLPVCHPWHNEDETICYKTADRCKHCRK